MTTETRFGCARCDAAASPEVINAERIVLSLLFTAWHVPRFVSLIDSFQDHPFLTPRVTPVVKQFVFFFFGFWGTLQYAEKLGKGHAVLTVFTSGKEKEAFSALTQEQ